MVTAGVRNRALCLISVLLCFLVLLAPRVYAEEQAVAVARTFDNLVVVEESPVAMAYINPDVDFSVFRRVAILEPYVAFRSNWLRDQNRTRSRNLSARDVARIKQDIATIFEREFSDRLEAAGYEVVDVAGDDVLVLRPAIIDLDVTAPDIRAAGRSRTYSASTGAATLYVQLFDSITGEIVGRAADRRGVRSPGGTINWTNSVTNIADARRIMGAWADILVDFLDRHYKSE